jgi:hypothetical protein
MLSPPTTSDPEHYSRLVILQPSGRVFVFRAGPMKGVVMYRRAVSTALVAMLAMLGVLAPLGVSPAAAQDEIVLTVSVEDAIVNPRTGVATLSGTLACSEPATVYFYGGLTQGEFSHADMYTEVYCPGPEGTTFSSALYPYQGRLHPGWADLYLELFARGYVCDVECTSGHLILDTTVRLTVN